MNGFVNFFPMDRHIFRGDYPETHLVAPNFDHRDNHVIVNDDGFVFFSGQDKHGCLSFVSQVRSSKLRSLQNSRVHFVIYC